MLSFVTDEMWADILTKPLQGQKFRDMRAFLQNCPRDYDDDAEHAKREGGPDCVYVERKALRCGARKATLMQRRLLHNTTVEHAA